MSTGPHNNNHSNNQSDLQILLDNDTLILHGSQQESSGCVLRGHVRLNLKESAKFKSITLRLIGKIKVAWSECKCGFIEQLSKYPNKLIPRVV
jgi:hypothetical protein